MALILDEDGIVLSDYDLGACHPLGQGNIGNGERG